jgi:hypothetical protein
MYSSIYPRRKNKLVMMWMAHPSPRLNSEAASYDLPVGVLGLPVILQLQFLKPLFQITAVEKLVEIDRPPQ